MMLIEYIDSKSIKIGIVFNWVRCWFAVMWVSGSFTIHFTQFSLFSHFLYTGVRLFSHSFTLLSGL